MIEIFWIGTKPRVPLAVVLCPAGDGALKDDLAALQQGGIETIVSLLEKDEAEWLGLAKEGPLAVKAGMQFLNHPIPDSNTPVHPAAFHAFIADIAERLVAGEHIGIHCRGSIGRSSVTAACALIQLGWTPATALAAIQAARGCAVPETLAQERWILNYRPLP